MTWPPHPATAYARTTDRPGCRDDGRSAPAPPVLGGGRGVAAGGQTPRPASPNRTRPSGALPQRCRSGSRSASSPRPRTDRTAPRRSPDDREKLVELLQKRERQPSGMTEGHLPGTTGAMNGTAGRPAGRHRRGLAGLLPSQPTITTGSGPTVLTKGRPGTAWLAERRPEGVDRPPHFPADRLTPATQRWRPVRAGLRPRSAGGGCTRCATWPASASGSSRSAGHSSVSVGRRRHPPHRTRLGTCSGSRTGPRTSRPREPDLLDEFIWVGRTTIRRGLDGRRFTWSRAGSTCRIETWDRTLDARERR